MAVAGQFYPGGKEELGEQVENFFKEYADAPLSADVRALIVPHAGYVYSGSVAASAYSRIPEDAVYKRIFLLGPSHRVYVEGASVDTAYGFAETPLGKVRIDHEVCMDLIRKDGSAFSYVPAAHVGEHDLEVQLPFLQQRLRNMPPIVPVIIGTQRISSLKKIAAVLKPYWNSDNLFIISSDFSHYPEYDGACKADLHTAEAICTGDLYKFVEALSDNDKAEYPGLETSACGQCAIATMLMLMEGSGCRIEHILYRNSGDSVYGEKDRVVGYNSFAVTGASAPAKVFSLSDSERKTLLAIARNSIRTAYQGAKPEVSWKGLDLTDNLKTECGAFVTLTEKGSLRGCIGHFGENVELYRLVAEMARAAAFEDTRFRDLSESELPEVKIEISVLTPLKRISSADDFHYGKEGIYMVLDGRSGTFLPQVADEVSWTKEEFLGHCAMDKAGIGWDGWKNAELFTYEAIIFSE